MLIMNKSILTICWWGGVIGMCCLVSCDQTTPGSFESEELVIEAFLMEGASQNTIQISEVTSYYSDSTEVGRDLDHFEGWLISNGDSTALESEGDGLYSIDSFPIIAGETYQLAINTGEEWISSETTIPSSPVGFAQSVKEIYFYRLSETSSFEERAANIQQEPLELTWDNDGTQYVVVKVENIENYFDWVNPDQVPDDPEPFLFTTSPEIKNTEILQTGRQFNQFGTYRIVLFHVTTEYAEVVSQDATSSFTLEEPITNISNGKGLFAGMSSDTLYLEVREH